MRPISPDPLVWTPAIVAGVLASLSLYLNRWGSYMKFMDRVGTYWDYNGDTFDFIISKFLATQFHLEGLKKLKCKES